MIILYYSIINGNINRFYYYKNFNQFLGEVCDLETFVFVIFGSFVL